MYTDARDLQEQNQAEDVEGRSILQN